jgi:hypothetical protein
VTSNSSRASTFSLCRPSESIVGLTWKIDFHLFERKKSDPFGDAIVILNVEVRKASHAKPEKAGMVGRSGRKS